jgi:hypothetical protein
VVLGGVDLAPEDQLTKGAGPYFAENERDVIVARDPERRQRSARRAKWPPEVAIGRSERPRHPEADAAEPVGCDVPEADGRAKVSWNVAPGTTAKHPSTAVSGYPDRTIGRRSRVVVVPAILHPVVDVAMHLVEAPWIGLE